MIPSTFTSIVQPCDVGINKPLKERLKKAVNSWRQAQYASLYSGDRMPTPKRADILDWLGKIWSQFPNEIVEIIFRKRIRLSIRRRS